MQRQGATGKCSAETVYRIAKALGVSMESLIEPCFDKRCDFELFKSSTCHKLKELGDIPFIIDLLERDEICKITRRDGIVKAFTFSQCWTM